ncbi:CdaR family transcriptional regulator [Leucobacter sp. BZR 635]
MSRPESAEHDREMRELIVRVGHIIQEMTPQIVEEMTDLLSERVSGLDKDAQMIQMLRASVDGNVWTIGHILTNDIAIESVQPSTAAVEYAMRLAQQDVQLGSLTRAYYLGQSLVVRRGIDVVDGLGLEDKDQQMNLVRWITDVIHNYIDWMLQYVTDVYVAEQAKWWTARAVTNAAAVLKTLRGEPISAAGFESRTKYSLEQHHVALIAWLEFDTSDTDEQRQIDQLLRRIAAILGSTKPPLITAADRMTAWAWVATPTLDLPAATLARVAKLAEAEEANNIRVAIGVPAHGVAGFRRSHEQATKARLVALGAQRFRESQLVAFSDPDVGFLSLLMHDPKSAITWTHEILGPVANGGEQHAALRETLATFYATGENSSKTAEVLGLHRNTVRQRVARFEQERGGEAVNGIEISLALKLFDLLGDG